VNTSGVVTVLFAFLPICFALSTSRSAVASAQADKLPEAPGKPVVITACTSCHDTSIMTDAPRTIAGWIDVMYLMKDFGAMLTEAESKTVTDYLVTNLALVELNKAEAGHLALVFGVTDAVAKDVIAYRDKQGGFKTIDDLKMAPGLDAARVDALKDRLLFR
jgi:competence protein ComEA